MSTALYPGSFDPVTVGHVDVIRRATRLFERLVIGVGVNPAKRSLFEVRERVELLRAALAGEGLAAEVVPFEGLVVECARRVGATCLVRGVRGATDFDYELPMAQTNQHLAPEVETVFLMPTPRHAFVSARLIREAGALGGDVSALLPEAVRATVMRRLRERAARGT